MNVTKRLRCSHEVVFLAVSVKRYLEKLSWKDFFLMFASWLCSRWEAAEVETEKRAPCCIDSYQVKPTAYMTSLRETGIWVNERRNLACLFFFPSFFSLLNFTSTHFLAHLKCNARRSWRSRVQLWTAGVGQSNPEIDASGSLHESHWLYHKDGTMRCGAQVLGVKHKVIAAIKSRFHLRNLNIKSKLVYFSN